MRDFWGAGNVLFLLLDVKRMNSFHDNASSCICLQFMYFVLLKLN